MMDATIDTLRTAWSRLRSTFTADRIDRDLDDELAAHLEMLTDELRRGGLSEAAARREAARKLGRLDPIREDHRTERGLPALDLLVQSLRHSLRRLARTPVFTAVVTLTLALGIGANTALFSLVDNLLLRSLPVRDPDQLVQLEVFIDQNRAKPAADRFDRATFAAVRAQNRVVEGVVGFDVAERVTITVDGAVEPERAVDWVSPNFFQELGVPTVIGRSADTLDANVAVISARWWHSRFGGRTDAIGRAIAIDGKTYTVIGVAPPRFHGFDIDRSTDVWISPSPGRLQMVARLQAGVSVAHARAALHSLLSPTVNARDQSEPLATEARAVGQGVSELRNQYRGALWALMALVTLVLFTTCANVGNLLMLRNTARRRELALRSALGAAWSRLVAHSFVETTLLAAAGCLGGLVFAQWGVSLVVAMLPLPAPPGSLTFHADAHVLVFTSVICVLSALMFGLAPAWRAADVDVMGALQIGAGSTAPKRARYFGRVLVSAQVALSVLLLVGAGLFVQTLRNLSRLQMGYSTERLLQISIDPRFAGYQEKDMPALAGLLLERVSALPGVRSASRTSWPLMRGSSTLMGIPLPGLPRGSAMWDAVDVGPQFFETMGIAVVRGRAFSASDFVADSVDFRHRSRDESHESQEERDRFILRAGPFVVNESFAKRLFAGADPMPAGSPIVGIVKDVKLFGVKDDVGPVMFLISRRPDRVAAIQVRSAGDPLAIQKAIRETIQSVNPRLLTGMSTLGEASGRSIAKERMVASVSGFFSALGLLLAAMGIFGIASSAVAQRTKELGIRRALGAGQWVLVRDSLREPLMVIGLGLIAGALAALVGVRVTSSLTADLLFGLPATHAGNLVVSVAVMVLIGIAACALPALRATRIDPLLCVRED